LNRCPAGSYRGQWLQGSRHGFGIRQSVPYGVAVHYRRHTTNPSSSSSHTPTDSPPPYPDDEQPGLARRARAADPHGRGGFVLVARSDSAGAGAAPPTPAPVGGLRGAVARTLRLRRQASAGEGAAGAARAGRRPIRDGSGSRSASEDRDSVRTDSCMSFTSQVTNDTIRGAISLLQFLSLG